MIKRCINIVCMAALIAAFFIALAPPLYAQEMLKVSTSATVCLGPFVDASDGVTLETAVDISTGIDYAVAVKNGSDTEVDLSSNSWAAMTDVDGYYLLTLSSTDTNSLGRLTVAISDADTFVPVWKDFMVVTANYFDSLFSTDTFDVNVTSIAANAITATAINADAITEAKIADNAIAAEHIAADAIGASEIAADAIASSEIAATGAGEVADAVWDEATSGHTTPDTYGDLATLDEMTSEVWAESARTLTAFDEDDLGAGLDINGTTIGTCTNVTTAATCTNVTNGVTLAADAITADKIADNAIAVEHIAADAITSSELAATGAGEIADAVWDEAISGHLSAGSTGELLQDIDNEVDYVHDQIDNFAIAGAATHATANANTTITTGTQSSGTYASTYFVNGTNHIITASSNTIDMYYEFDISVNGVPTEVTIVGYLKEGAPAGGDTISLQARYWTGASWDEINSTIFTGITTDTNALNKTVLLARHVGTGDDVGKVRVRFYSNSLEDGTTLNIDQIYVSYSTVLSPATIATGVWGADKDSPTADSYGWLANTLLDVLAGRMKIDAVANTLIFYDYDADTTPSQTFYLLDSTGNSTHTNVYERDKDAP